ncbi:MAG: hypothetical protein IT189_00530 [Microbacteriaceae bacterium]|nr:hypothetical protein [Microbacteriaceae bacterium]HQG69098.1 hypothetical protein [Rhodoglobus sp.]HQJ33571.1 hypothetical protein [Rhodoglobus sp.]
MSWLSRRASEIAGRLVRNRDRLPRFLDRLITSASKNPDGVVGRMASLLLAGSSQDLPAATTAPPTPTRIYIGPTNYAGQGYLWARALIASRESIGARNMEVELPGTFAFPADTVVPVGVYNRSKRWQEREFEAVAGFTHVLLEAERPLFGTLFDRDIRREVDALQQRGLSVAYLSHGTDARSPRNHTERTPWSPFADDAQEAARLQADADHNIALLVATDRPVFVSTPDLLFDLPSATWCPVVVDPSQWAGARPLLSAPRPVVAHIPSMSSMKGTHLIEAPIRALAERGTVDYRGITGVPAASMPAIIGDTDIVLDQFRLGSYGVAACEAMAAGRVVVGHVLPDVRDHVRRATGLSLPIVEATPTTLAVVIAELLGDPARMKAIGAQSAEFVASVHAGPLSAAVLTSHWIDAC